MESTIEESGVTFAGTCNTWCSSNVLFVACALFGEVRRSLFVAGALFGEIRGSRSIW